MRDREERDDGHVGAQRAPAQGDLLEAALLQQLELARLLPATLRPDGEQDAALTVQPAQRAADGGGRGAVAGGAS